ncbi:MAG: hypothetical protein PVF27_04280 [Gemmatimonadales bacterium]
MWATGAALAALAVGQLLGGAGLYGHIPIAVWLGWIGAAVGVVWAVRWGNRRRRDVAVDRLARAVERGGGQRRGAVAGPAAWEATTGSAALASLADRRASAWLAREGTRALGAVVRRSRRRLTDGATVFVAGTLLFLGATLVGGDGGFWRPVAVTLRARGPVSLVVDRTHVGRGEQVTAVVTAPGRRAATLLVRAPGEEWTARRLRLDSAGRVSAVLGPLESDRFLRAVAGERRSDVVHVSVALPALLVDLEVTARFPAYLGQPDEPLLPGDGPVPLPLGTRVEARGRATVPLAGARWESDAHVETGVVDGERFVARFAVRASGPWHLRLTAEPGDPIEGDAPTLDVIAVRDSAPVVQVPVPGADTVAPLSLRQRLLIDARDDHGIARLEVVRWRVSRFGIVDPPDSQAVPVPAAGVPRAVVSWVLDLNDRGLLPGDTAYFRVRAVDNAPRANVGTSATYRLRLASMSELRQAARARTARARTDADSLVEAQDDLSRRLEELAAERERQGRPSAAGEADTREQLPYSVVERAQALLDEERSLAERAAALSRDVRDLSDAAWAAGVTDPELQRALRDVEELLTRALDDELVQRIARLQDALDRLDAAGVRRGLQELAAAAQELQAELERGRELFERAALEGDLTSLAADADALAHEQRAWNEAPEAVPDSAAVAFEEDLARRADSLAAALQRVSERMDSLRGERGALDDERAQAERAGDLMEWAAQQAAEGRRAQARRSGEAASEVLDPMAQRLRRERNALREAWRREVMAQMDRALVETGELIRRQEDVTRRMQRGAAGADVRGEQAAVREGVERVVDRLTDAAGKNALVSPQLGAALGFARQRMDDALNLLQQPTPGTRDAAGMAWQALEQLGAVVHAMLRARGDVQGAGSGSGLAEAMERLAELAEQQGALNGQTGGLMQMLSEGGAQVLQQLRELAARERRLAQDLERLRAQGGVSGADRLAEEAREIARRLEEGRLGSDVIERQERLFRRLLDAGRSLESEEEDPRLERQSESADPTLVAPPAGERAAQSAPRFRFPTWEELRALTPEERRLILEYFRRLNDARRP